VARGDAQTAKLIKQGELQELFDPQGAFGAASPMTEQVLSDWSSARGSAA
jgi:hypothetical protein